MQGMKEQPPNKTPMKRSANGQSPCSLLILWAFWLVGVASFHTSLPSTLSSVALAITSLKWKVTSSKARCSGKATSQEQSAHSFFR